MDEIDESKFGKRKYNWEHKVRGGWISGMFERFPERKISLVAVEDQKAVTLNWIMSQNVHNQCIIYSDCAKAYKNVVEKLPNI